MNESMAALNKHLNTCLLQNYRYLVINKYKKCYLSYHSENIKTITKTMPKDNSQLIQKLRDTRIMAAKKKAVNNTFPSNVVQLHVLGNGSKGNPRAIYLLTERNSYLFNCGEGTQRLAHEHRIKLSKLENILLTSSCSENMSGLVGLTLTAQDIGIPSLTLHGPKNMDQVLALYNNFLKISGMKVQKHDYSNHIYEDTDIEIKCLPIYRQLDDIKQMTKKLKTETTTKGDSDNCCFVYFCRLKTKPGELLIKKCIELKVPPGPLLGKLKAGQDVVLPDERVIKSEDVIGPEEKGPIFIVLECPSLDYIDSLINNNQFSEYYDSNIEDSKLLSVMIHFCSPEVINNEKYQEWVSKFDESVTHIVCNDETSSQSFIAANLLQIRLNLIDSYIFPILDCTKKERIKQSSPNSNRIISAEALLKYHLRPSNLKGLDNENDLSIDEKSIIVETLSNQDFSETLKIFHSQSSALNIKTQEYPEVIFLGTGSALPGKVRNTSAIWVNIDDETSLLLDCGEGTYGQVFRFFSDECESQLKKLKAIYVSHLHADHHLGILQLIKNRSFVTKDTILLIIPPKVESWLQSYDTVVEPISHLYQVIPCERFRVGSDEEVLKTLSLSELKTTFVSHCDHSYGMTFTIRNDSNCKIVYSGDCIPSDKLVAIGMNCDLLIHEATMEDELIEEAKIKFHSTTSQAIDIGNKMSAKFTILTHFSQRYAKIPVFNEKFSNRVGIAFDNMRVRISDLNKLPLMIPTLKCLFMDHIEEQKAKTAHKSKRRQLLTQYYSDIQQSNF